MIEFDIIDKLGDNADFLIKSDEWLEAAKVKLNQDLTLLLHDIEQIQTTIKIKHQLQQNNYVAVKRKTDDLFLDLFFDEVIEIHPLSRAIELATKDQINVWAADGYDVGDARMDTK